MIARAGMLRRPGPGPVLVKGVKPGQEGRADRPTIGPQTVAAVVAAGFRGIVVEAGATLVVDCSATIEARSEEHTSDLKSLMRISYAVFCLKKKTNYRSHIIK